MRSRTSWQEDLCMWKCSSDRDKARPGKESFCLWLNWELSTNWGYADRKRKALHRADCNTPEMEEDKGHRITAHDPNPANLLFLELKFYLPYSFISTWSKAAFHHDGRVGWLPRRTSGPQSQERLLWWSREQSLREARRNQEPIKSFLNQLKVFSIVLKTMREQEHSVIFEF